MNYKKILTVQDISCVGQCSLTVALPILSACGLETCILPSAVLSTHSVGFTDYTFRDLTDDMPKIQEHWQREGIMFDAIYTGYLGNIKQIDQVKQIFSSMGTSECIRFVDPVMAEGGKLYPGFDESYVAAIKKLCQSADVILPNITEACLLTGTDYKEKYDEAYIHTLMQKLSQLGAGTVIMTGVGYASDKTCIATYDNGQYYYYEHDKIDTICHGTGDIFASALVGAVMNGLSIETSIKIAADYTLQCIVNTQEDKKHWYGVHFEPVLHQLISYINEAVQKMNDDSVVQGLPHL